MASININLALVKGGFFMNMKVAILLEMLARELSDDVLSEHSERVFESKADDKRIRFALQTDKFDVYKQSTFIELADVELERDGNGEVLTFQMVIKKENINEL